MTKDQERTIKDWELSCNLLAKECGKHLYGEDYDFLYDFWFADIVGGVFEYNGWLGLNCEDMTEVLKEGTTIEQLYEWHEANVNNEQFINLHSWLKGLRHEHLTNE